MQNSTAQTSGRSSAPSQHQQDLLLFSLGQTEVFAVQVYSVREVCERVAITRTPQADAVFCGVISLRGLLMPVVDLAEAVGMPCVAERRKLIIVEQAGRVQALLVAEVDRIVRVSADQMQEPTGLSMQSSPALKGIVELGDGTLVSLLDVSRILAGLQLNTIEGSAPELAVSPEAQFASRAQATDSASQGQANATTTQAQSVAPMDPMQTAATADEPEANWSSVARRAA